MERELTPVEARSGVVSGRIITVLALSSVGAVVALALAWLFLFPRYGGWFAVRGGLECGR